MRSNDEFRFKAAHVSNWQDPEYETYHGINRLSIFSQLTSIDFPRSFPVDGIHAFFENVVGSLFDHMRGRFPVVKPPRHPPKGPPPKPPQPTPSTHNHTVKSRNTHTQTSSSNTSSTETPDSHRHQPTHPESTRHPINDNYTGTSNERNPKAALKGKFCQSDEPYCVPPVAWDEVAKDMSRSKSTFATSLGHGEPIRSITRWCHQYKATEWKNWTIVFSPIYLKPNLPADFYEMYMKLIRAIQLSCKTFILPKGIDKVPPPPNMYTLPIQPTYVGE